MGAPATQRARRIRSSRGAATPVLHVITSTDRRGAETFAVDLAAALAARGRQGRTVALSTRRPGGLPVPVLGRRAFGPETIRALRREAAAARVVVAHGSSTVLACALATLGLGTPFVYRNIGDPAFWLDTARKRWQTRWILRRARATVALWPGSAEALRALAGERADVRIIPTGVPAEIFEPAKDRDRRAARRRLGIEDGSVVALYVGSLSPEKSVETAIAAVAAIPEATLLVVGEGSERARLEAIAGSSGGRIVFLGARDRPREELAASDVLVLTSRTEGLPAVLMEAGLSERPVVASAVGGIPEIVDHGVTGLVVPFGDVPAFADAIRAAAAARESLGRAARKRCLSRYEIGVVAAAWDALLADLGAWEPPK